MKQFQTPKHKKYANRYNPFKETLQGTMTFRKYLIWALFNLSFIGGFGQTYDFVKVIAGKGIVFNSDSILLFKTSIKKTCEIFKIKDISNNSDIKMVEWDGYKPETLEMTGGTEWIKEVRFKNIVIEFSSDTDRKTLKLRRIRIGEDKTMKIYTDNGLEIGEINPHITSQYPIVAKKDYISDDLMVYNLYSYGISFKLDKLENNDLRLVEISTHYKILDRNGL